VKIDDLFLIGGTDIVLGGGIVVHQPRLDAIRQPEVGYAKYNGYVSLMALTPEMVIGEKVWDGLSLEDKAAITMYALVTSIQALTEEYREALSFFVGPLEYADGVFRLGDGSVIDAETFDLVRGAILVICGTAADDVDERPPTGKKARILWEKRMEGRKRMRKQRKADAGMELPNIISVLCARSPAYNLTNVWDLTVWQLYDQFSQVYGNVQIGVMAQRWAAWGKEDFDFSIWYKTKSKN